jgi:hypothetical protein
VIASPFALLDCLVTRILSVEAGALAAGGALFLWVVFDMQPWVPLGSIGRTAWHELMAAVVMPAGVAEAQAEGKVQAKAMRKAECAATTLAQMRNAAPQSEIDDHLEDQPEIEEDVEAEAGGPEVQPTESEALELELREAWLQQSPRAARSPLDDSSPAWPVGCRRVIGFILVYMSLFISGLWAMSRSSIRRQVVFTLPVWTVAISGIGYWLIIFFLLALLPLCQPPARELKRGLDGFYLVRSLGTEERQRFAASREK